MQDEAEEMAHGDSPDSAQLVHLHPEVTSALQQQQQLPPGVGRVVMRVAPIGRNVRIDTFFTSGMQVLEQLLALRGRLQALSSVQGNLNQMLLEHAIQISMQEQGPTGPPPIEEADWKNTPEVVLTEYHFRLEANQTCTVCREQFHVGQRARQLPCGHVFCNDCIGEWLKLHRSCPMCRKEVVDVPKPTWELSSCGFEQLRKKECFGISTTLIVLPACSHGFHRSCLRRYLRLRMKEKTDDFKMECPLCKTVSSIARKDLGTPWTGATLQREALRESPVETATSSPVKCEGEQCVGEGSLSLGSRPASATRGGGGEGGSVQPRHSRDRPSSVASLPRAGSRSSSPQCAGGKGAVGGSGGGGGGSAVASGSGVAATRAVLRTSNRSESSQSSPHMPQAEKEGAKTPSVSYSAAYVEFCFWWRNMGECQE